MYIQGMAQQTQVFLLSVGFGFLAGAVYDIICFVRKIISEKSGFVVFQDILFASICAVSAFMFLLCINDGKLRLYPYLGMISGFAVWYFTLGVPVRYVFERISGFVSRFLKGIVRKIREIFRKTKKFFKKMKNKPSKPLEMTADSGV